jgi:hypothetical protein
MNLEAFVSNTDKENEVPPPYEIPYTYVSDAEAVTGYPFRTG